MTYQTPELLLIGAAHALVISDGFEDGEQPFGDATLGDDEASAARETSAAQGSADNAEGDEASAAKRGDLW